MNSARALRWNTYAHIFWQLRKLQRPSQKFSRRLWPLRARSAGRACRDFFRARQRRHRRHPNPSPATTSFRFDLNPNLAGRKNPLSVVTTYPINATTGALTGIARSARAAEYGTVFRSSKSRADVFVRQALPSIPPATE